MSRRRAAIVTVSDSRTAGSADDLATPVIEGLLAEGGFEVVARELVSDDSGPIEERLTALCDGAAVDLVVTSGGTGLGPRDVTPEATLAVGDREVPGIAEAMRSLTASEQPLAWLSRGVAVQRGRTLVVNLPGSPRGAQQCLAAVTPLLGHALDVIGGHSHD